MNLQHENIIKKVRNKDRTQLAGEAECAETPIGRLRSQSTPKGGNRSVTRALLLILDIAHSKSPQSFVDLQRRHKVPKATMHNLLLTLEGTDFVKRDVETGKYSVGFSALQVAAAAAAGPSDLPVLLGPTLQRLVEENNETCHLGILHGGGELILKRLDPHGQIVRLAPTIGSRHPAHASSGGIASMALTFSEANITALPDTLTQLTKNTIKTRDQLRQRLNEVREKGYALDLEEAYLGVRCVAVAISVPDWPVIHISFSLPLQRAPVERLRALAKPLAAAAKEIKNILSVTPRA